MARNFWQEEIAAGSLPVDLMVDPNNAANPQYPADWIELPGGGTLTYLDGSGETQTITNAVPGYVQQSPRGYTKLISLTGASSSNNVVRCGTGGGPKTTNIVLIPASTSPYTPAVSSNWTGTPPTTIGAALDRIAAALNVSGSLPSKP